MRLMLHTVVGYPTLAASEEVVGELAKVADLIELQIPFSDPVADGPVLTLANEAALTEGVTAKEVFGVLGRASAKYPSVGFLVMCYANTVLAYGVPEFFREVAKKGGRGVIIPDIPLEERGQFEVAAQRNKVSLVPVIAPNTEEARVKALVTSEKEPLLVYFAARKGVTGSTTDFSASLKKPLAMMRRYTKAPLAVGFGVRSGADVHTLAKAGADIAVVGSALVTAYKEGNLAKLREAVAKLGRAAGT